jgi:hypothetical protein
LPEHEGKATILNIGSVTKERIMSDVFTREELAEIESDVMEAKQNCDESTAPVHFDYPDRRPQVREEVVRQTRALGLDVDAPAASTGVRVQRRAP